MINCSNKLNEKATKYFIFKHENTLKFYPACCQGCVKSIIKKIILGKPVKTISEDQNKVFEKNIQKLTDQNIENIEKILTEKEKEIIQI